MDIAELLIFVWSCCLCLRSTSGQLSKAEGWDKDKFKEEAGQTFNLVFHKYNPRVRPPQAYITINVSITLRHIRHLDVRKQELQTVLDIEMDWVDTRLRWYPERMDQIFANTSAIWSPDIVFTNSVAANKVIYPSVLRISHNGDVYWTRKEVVTTQCPTSLNTSEQNCVLALGFMSNSRNDQTDRFFSKDSTFNIPADFVNHEWNLKNADLQFEDIINETEHLSPTMVAELWVERRTLPGDNYRDVFSYDENDEDGTYSTTSEANGGVGQHNGHNANGVSPIAAAHKWLMLMMLLTPAALSTALRLGVVINR